MASTFSPSLRIELIGDGDQSGIWGQTTNSNLGTIVEQAITGVVNIPMLDSNYTMTNFNGVSDESRNAVLVLTGTLTQQRNLIAPLVEKTYSIKNTTTGGFGVQVVGSSGTGVVIPNGQTIPVYCDGSNFYALVTGTATNFNVAGNLTVTGTSTFTGIPTGPTAAVGTNTTQLATTAFVQATIPAGVILLWSGSIASIPSGWLLCDGTSGTPNLRDRFVVGAGTTYAVGASGGVAATTLIEANLPSHTHSISAAGTTAATNIDHTHGIGISSGAMSANNTHSHVGTTNGQSNGHSHNLNTNQGQISFFAQSTGGGPAQAGFTGGVPVCLVSPTTSDVSADHNHSFGTNTVDVNHTHFVSGNSFGMNSNTTHTHTVTVTGTSGATGSGTAFSNLPPYYALAYIMKA
jgi:microcystin-dependent protein